MLSDIWSATLSGCPSVTDSDVNNFFIYYLLFNLLRKKLKVYSLSFYLSYLSDYTAGISTTLYSRLLGFTGPVPSTPLNKLFYLFTCLIILLYLIIINVFNIFYVNITFCILYLKSYIILIVMGYYFLNYLLFPLSCFHL